MNGCNNCAKRRDVQKECPWGGTYHHRGEHGERIGTCNAYRKETNADRIRAMSDEELAQFIPNWSYTKACKCDEQRFVDCNNECEKCVADWLQQPAPEEGEQNV